MIHVNFTRYINFNCIYYKFKHEKILDCPEEESAGFEPIEWSKAAATRSACPLPAAIWPGFSLGGSASVSPNRPPEDMQCYFELNNSNILKTYLALLLIKIYLKYVKKAVKKSIK